ncbi:MAG: ATP synthase F1 subunit delta [Actinomycetota bacterium]|nr:ATP synthase F1 subunit delta [Actinomycetota bacterium]
MTERREELIDGYAQALLSAAEAEDALGPVEDELYEFAKAVETNTGLREALTDVTLPIENKKGLIRDVVSERANPVAATLIGFIVEAGRAREFGKIVEAFAALAAEKRRHVLAEVRSAVPLDEARRKRLAAALSTATGNDVEVKVAVDPSLVGGIVARVGDEVFDGSIASRLDDAKLQMGSA